MACCMRTSGVDPPRSCVPSRPHDHWIVPAPKTSASAVAVLGQVMGGRAWRVVRAVVLEPLDPVHGGARVAEQARWPGAVVEILVPLVPDRVGGQGRRLTGLLRRRRWSPARGASCHRPPAPRSRPCRELTMKMFPVRAFSGSAPSGLTGPRVAPSAGPDVRLRIDLGVGVGLLVRDERAVAVRRCCLPARLPEDLVPAEEAEVHAGVARGLRRCRAVRSTSTRRGLPKGTPCARSISGPRRSLSTPVV